jgi:hypothetical protein
MSENDQPQEPLNTRISDDTGGVENPSNARGDATTSEGQTWQINDFGDLLNLGELDRYLPVEIQHILALSYAFRSVMPTFYQMYANAFQDKHEISIKKFPQSFIESNPTIRLISISYPSILTPNHNA